MIHQIHKLHRIHKTKRKNFLDKLIYFFVFTTPLFELPQAYTIYSKHDAEHVSLTTWAYFAVSSAVWLCYGLHKRLRPVIFAYSLYIVIETAIVVGILRYS